MASKTTLKIRLENRQKALDEAWKAYHALLSGQVQSYSIGSRQLLLQYSLMSDFVSVIVLYLLIGILHLQFVPSTYLPFVCWYTYQYGLMDVLFY